MTNFTDNINNLTPVFRSTVEKFIPEWLESFVPHYQEAKENKVDILDLSNVRSSIGKHYEHNGFHYCLFSADYGMSFLSLDNSNGHYTRTGFRECIVKMYPDLDYAPNPDMGKFSELFKNSIYFDYYLWRIFNRKPPYDDLNNKIDAHFKRLTGDDNVEFSLSGTSMLYFNERAKMYINNYCSFQ